MSKVLFFIAPFIFLITTSSNGQENNQIKMKAIAAELIAGLNNCDTSKILKLYDTSASHINQKNYRDYLKEDISNECSLFAKVARKYGVPDLGQITYSKDSSNQANVVMIRLIPKADSGLNLKNSKLFIMFSPDKFFTNKIVRFTILEELINKKHSDKVEMPPM